ncbi:MAG: hypothetical protein IJC74_06330 [Clostridia bacterium]|nr:hypothetical protein [Clostridia bacterium]
MKKIVSIILVALMILSSALTAGAFECYPVYGKAVVSDLLFENSEGKEITTVPADGKIFVSCGITKGADMYAQNATLIAAVYNGNQLKDIQHDKKALLDDKQTFRVKLENVSATSTVKVFVWDEFSKAEPLAYAGLLGGKNAKLWDISIDGKTITGFNADTTEYTVNFPASYTSVPDVSALAYELSTKVDIKYSYLSENSLNAVIKTVSQDGSASKTYNLTCNYANPEITDIIAKTASGDAVLTTKIAAKPSYKTQPSVLPSAVSTDAQKAEYFAANCNSFSPMYQLRDFYLYDYPAYLDGAVYPVINYDYRNDATYNGSNQALKITLNRSATVYVAALWNWAAGYMSGWKSTGDKLEVVCVNNAIWDSFRTPDIYYQRFEVPEGKESVDVVIEGIGSGKPQVVPFIVFDENEKMDIADEESAAITGIKVDSVEIEGFVSDKYAYSMNVPEGYTGSYEVVATPANENTQISYEESEINGNNVVTVNASYGNDTKQYTITFITVASAITNAKAYTANGEVALTFATANNPVFKNEPSVTPDNAAGKNDSTEAEYYTSNCESTSPFYTLREFYMYNVPEKLQGAQYTLNSYEYRSDATFNDVTTPSMTFDLNNSATVYIVNLWNQEPAWLAEEGFVKSDLTIDCIEYNNNNFDTFRSANTIWEKRVEVGIGETKTITIKGTGSGKPQEVAFVVWE